MFSHLGAFTYGGAVLDTRGRGFPFACSRVTWRTRMQRRRESLGTLIFTQVRAAGLQEEEGAKELRSGAEMIRSSMMRMMEMCTAARVPIGGD